MVPRNVNIVGFDYSVRELRSILDLDWTIREYLSSSKVVQFDPIFIFKSIKRRLGLLRTLSRTSQPVPPPRFRTSPRPELQTYSAESWR